MAKTTRQPRTPQRETHKQSGGTFLGIVLGLIVGLGIAVVVALYITRAPTPFVAKAPNGGDTAASAPPAGQFDPNRILQGKSPGLAVAPATTAAAPENTAPQPDAKAAAPSGIFPEPQIVEVPPATPAAQAPTQAPAQAQTPRAPAAPTAAVSPPVVNEANTGYFLQIGAYKTTQDAQQQRARLALQGFESSVTQRDSGGITYFRVRIGPFSKFDEMNNTRQQLSNAGIDSAVIRFTKQ